MRGNMFSAKTHLFDILKSQGNTIRSLPKTYPADELDLMYSPAMCTKFGDNDPTTTKFAENDQKV